MCGPNKHDTETRHDTHAYQVEYILLLLAFLMTSGNALGQNKADSATVISGIIVDKSGAPLELVNIRIEGTTSGTISDSTGLGKLEEKLDPKRFMRVHRSYIIAVDKLKNLESSGGGGFTGVMNDGSEIKVSRSRAEKIKHLLI